jgi:hypothetical protein
VRAFTDSLLDLIVDKSVKNLVDLYGKNELIYLGPDEQVRWLTVEVELGLRLKL